MRGIRPFWPVVAAVSILGPWRPSSGEDAAPPPPPAAPPNGTPASPAPAPATKPLGEKEKNEAIPLLRSYLAGDSEKRTVSRLDFKKWIDLKAKAGMDPLADIGGLLDAIYKARPFAPAYEKKAFRDGKFEIDAVNRITSLGTGDGSLRYSFSLPPKYPNDPRKANTVPPLPTIVTLHDLVDYQEGSKTKDFPGLETIKRRYSRSGPMKAVTEEWMIVAPVSTRAQFDTDVIRRIVTPFREFWTHHHVDFDRVVLDGGDDVLGVAVSIPVFFNGLIVRGDPRTLDPKLAVNIAHLPIYVVGGEDAPAAKWLKGAGLTPTVGTADGVAEWLKGVREKPRKVPTEFKWRVKDRVRQVLAHWVNVNESEPDSDLAVKVDKETNTIEVTAKGVTDVALFLNDRIVDLSKPVKLVLNGKSEPPKTFTRNLDTMFENEAVAIRDTGYFGWLYPVLLMRLKIPVPEEQKPESTGGKDGKPAEGAAQEGTPTSSGSAEERDAEAGVLFEKAEQFEKAGNVEKALTFFKKVVAVGASSFKEKAEAKVKELEAKAPAPPAKAGSAGK
jgi:hypothetical protein